MSPVLVPAWPEVLRVGLPVVNKQGHDIGVFMYECNDSFLGETWCKIYSAHELGEQRLSSLRLDLRDPYIHDAVVRAMWRTLRRTTVRPASDVLDMREASPGVWEPEPVNAPQFDHVANRRCWVMWAGGGGRGACFTPDGTTFFPSTVHAVPALASVPLDSPDRDLLALAACAEAVFEVSRG